MKKKWNRIWHKQQVSAFAQEREVYELYAGLLGRLLEEALQRHAIEGHGSARAKEVASFAEKAIRKFDRYPDPLHQFTDLCGGRFVVLTQPEADRMAQFVRRNFVIDEENSEDVRTRLKPDQFGYRAIHYIVQMPWVGLLGHGKCKATLDHFSRDARRNLRPFLQRVGDAESDRLLAAILCATFGERAEAAIYNAIRSTVPPLMDPEGVQMLESAINRTIEEEHLDRRGTLQLMCRIGNRKAEIQVQTVLQHAWSAVSHDRLYKTSFHPPRELERQLTRVAALLEEGDEQFSKTISELQTYQLDYGNYLSPDQIEAEIAKWQAVADLDPTNLKVALTIAEYAKAIERWEDIIKMLAPLEQTGDHRVLRMLGLARSRQLGGGRETLSRARTAAPHDPTGLYLLAETYCRHSANCEKGDQSNQDSDCARALLLYAEALNGTPLGTGVRAEAPIRDPHAFRKYAECMICCGRCRELCAISTPALEAAWNTACRRSEVHVRAPESLYDMGFFALLLGRQSLSLGAYAKAVFLSSKDGPIKEELEVITRLRNTLQGAGSPSIDLRDWDRVILFLRLAKVAKLQQMARQAPRRAEQREEQLKAREQELAQLQAELEKRKQRHAAWANAQPRAFGSAEDPGPDTEIRLIQEIHQAVEAAAGAVGEAQDAVARAQQLLSGARTDVEAMKKRAADALEELRSMGLHNTSDAKGKPLPFSKQNASVVILVGGCDPGSEALMQAHRPMLLDAFGGFSGVLCSGGTKAGIAAIAGDIQESNPDSTSTVGYLPDLEAGKKADKISANVTKDQRYKCLIDTSGDDFTALEPLQYWTDIIAAGVQPYDVKLLGINGGQIAALEYRMALAFDASVAVLERSGREAARLLQNEEWGLAERLMVLPVEVAIVKAYVRAGRISATGDLHAAAESIAPLLHADYVELCTEQHRNENRSLCGWEKLTSDLKDSNYQQALHWADHLAQIGCAVQKVDPATPSFELTPEEAERLAEIEHARYLVERFLKGWKWGDQRDNDKKINPTLVGWEKLPDFEKDKDRRAVSQMVRHLKETGRQIVKCAADKVGGPTVTNSTP